MHAQPLGDETIRGLDAATGRELWRTSHPSDFKGDQYVYGPGATPAGVGDAAVCLSTNGKLRCLALADGKLRWERDPVADYGILVKGGHSIHDSCSSPLVVGKRIVLMCCGTAGLVALNAADARDGYKELARATVTDRTWSHPALCHGKLYIRTDTRIVCLNLAAR